MNIKRILFIQIIITLILSVLVVGVIRIIGHTLSSMVFYGYTLEASLVYNISYVLPSILICMAVLVLLLPTLKLLNKYFPTKFSKKFN